MPKLTRALIDRLEKRERRYDVWDSELPRFGVTVHPTGRKVYVCRYRTPEKPDGTRHHIGRCSDMPPDKARELARQVFQSVSGGVDPVEQRFALREAPTLAMLRDEYTERHAKVRKKSNSQRHDAGLWKNDILPALGETTRITAVDRSAVEKMHAAIYKSGRLHTANRALALLSKAFNLAIEWKWLSTPVNPCKGIKKFKEPRRERPVRPEELKALGDALLQVERERPDLWRGVNLVWLWLLTGARMNEIQQARWNWVDWERRLLVLPDSKGGQKLINLPGLALERLRALPSRGKSAFLFPGDVKGQAMVNPRKTIDKVWDAAKVDDLRVHDLRHVFGSIAGMTGANIRLIADMLGHAQLSTTERYIQGVGNAVQVAADTTAERINGMMGGAVDVAAGK